jgi:hypothetical protein
MPPRELLILPGYNILATSLPITVPRASTSIPLAKTKSSSLLFPTQRDQAKPRGIVKLWKIHTL